MSEHRLGGSSSTPTGSCWCSPTALSPTIPTRRRPWPRRCSLPGGATGSLGPVVPAAAVDPGRAAGRRTAAPGAGPGRGSSPKTAPPTHREAEFPVARVVGLTVRHGDVLALRQVSLDVCAGDVVAVMGRNGAGKSTLPRRAGRPACRDGSGDRAGHRPGHVAGRRTDLPSGSGPQEPQDLLWAETIAAGVRRPTATRGGAGHRRRAIGAPAGRSTIRPIPTICPRALACCSSWRSCWPAIPTSCCWTNRRAVWTTPPRHGSRGSWPSGRRLARQS